MDVAFTKMSSKGQIVIPSEMREGMKIGEQLLIIRKEDQFVIRKASTLEKNLRTELEFARRTDEAFKRFEKGKFKSMSMEDFVKEMREW